MHDSLHRRIAQLLADEATGDLADKKRAAIEQVAYRTAVRVEFMHAAALAQVVLMLKDPDGPETTPPGLQARLRQQAAEWEQRNFG